MNLMEVCVSSLLVGTLLVGALTTTGNVARGVGMIATVHHADEYAVELMDEITSLPTRILPDDVAAVQTASVMSGTARDAFTQLMDFNGYVQSPPTQIDQSTPAGLQNWSVNVTVIPVVVDGDSVAALADPTLAGDDHALFLVTISLRDLRPGSDPRTTQQLVSRYERAQDVAGSASGLGRVTLGQSGGQTWSITTALPNLPPTTP